MKTHKNFVFAAPEHEMFEKFTIFRHVKILRILTVFGAEETLKHEVFGATNLKDLLVTFPTASKSEILTVFGFIGSPLKRKSNTYTLAKMMINKLVEMDNDIKFDLITAGDVNIQSCKGCWSCMNLGKCPLDKKDDMAFLKEKMLNSDFIIWGSPVYAMHVSGQMKIFLDRLASWYHTFRLVGKPGITVSTTAGAGLGEVHDYLKLVLNAAGVKVISSLGSFGTLPGTLTDTEEALKSAHKAAHEVYPYLVGERKVETDEGLEYSFQVNKSKVIYGAEVLKTDYEYWKENKMLEMNSFEDLLKRIS